MSSLEQTLGHVSNLHGDLNSLLEQLNNMRSKLKGHEPPRVLPADVEKQLKKLSVSKKKMIKFCIKVLIILLQQSVENSYAELQPQISKAKQDGTVFTAANGTMDMMPSEGTLEIKSSKIRRFNMPFFVVVVDVPSGIEIQQLLGDIEQANKEVGDLAGYWKDLLNASLETAKKFEADQR